MPSAWTATDLARRGNGRTPLPAASRPHSFSYAARFWKLVGSPISPLISLIP